MNNFNFSKNIPYLQKKPINLPKIHEFYVGNLQLRAVQYKKWSPEDYKQLV